MLGKGLESLIPPKSQTDADKTQTNADNQAQTNADYTQTNAEIKTQTDVDNQRESAFSPRKSASSLPRSELALLRGQRKSAASQQEAVFHIEVDKIRPNPHQPRRNFDEEGLKELAASIREFGILQPLVVSKIEKETDFGTEVEYQLIAGERRLMAAKMLGLERVPAIIRSISQKSEQLAMAIIENLQRANLNPIETARAYAKLQDEFGLTQREIATKIGKSRETVANTLRLLNLPSEIQEALAKNQINESQARLLLVIEDPHQQQNLFKELLANNLSVRELRQRIRKTQFAEVRPPEIDDNIRRSNLQNIDPEIVNLQEKLTELLGAKVKIEPAEKGGKIIITFYSPEEIQGIINKLTMADDND